MLKPTHALLLLLSLVACLFLPDRLTGISVTAQHFGENGATATVPLIISEFRLRGPNGPNDEFVEIYNNSDFAHTVNSIDGTASGYALVGSSNAVIESSFARRERDRIKPATMIRTTRIAAPPSTIGDANHSAMPPVSVTGFGAAVGSLRFAAVNCCCIWAIC